MEDLLYNLTNQKVIAPCVTLRPEIFLYSIQFPCSQEFITILQHFRLSVSTWKMYTLMMLLALCHIWCTLYLIIHSDLESRVNNPVRYNLPDIYLVTPLSIFTINITLGNQNIKIYTIKCYVYIIVDHTQF